MRSPSLLLVLAGLLAAPPLSAQVIEYETVEAVADPFFSSGGERSLFFDHPPLPLALATPLAMPLPPIFAPSPTMAPPLPMLMSVMMSLPEPAPVPAAPIPAGVAAYGPFRVLDAHRAALVDVTDGRTPTQFAAMLKAYPGIGLIEMIECPGTEDDLANMRLGRMIRAQGIVTYVPRGGSVRSGAVELFLAGARRYADPGSEFAVHSWLDDTGLEPGDYAASAPENRRYVEYYRQMGMSPVQATAFYAMTNSVPFESARWFGANEMAMWVPLDATVLAVAEPRVPESARSEPLLLAAASRPVLDSRLALR